MGLFLSGNTDYACTESPALTRLDLETGELQDAAGLPTTSCNGLDLGNLVEVDGGLVASFDSVLDPRPETFRSGPDGMHWTRVDAPNAPVTAAAEVDAGTFVLFGAALVRHVDGTFEPVPVPDELGELTDIAVLDEHLVIATRSWTGPSVWASVDGEVWEPLADLGPVFALDARDGILAAGTATAGAWLMSDCFHR